VVLPGGQRLLVEVARTPEEQARGLMYRTELAPDSGMLFVYESERVLPFWMKNTWIDLDILYLDREGRITKIFRRVPRSTPQTPESRVVRVHGWGRYVLELPAGAATRYRLKKGDKLVLGIRHGTPDDSGGEAGRSPPDSEQESVLRRYFGPDGKPR